MSEQNIDFQARIYLYDLRNCAREFGFRADERWEVHLASADEKTELERIYFPTLSAKLPADILTETLSQIKTSLSQKVAEQEKNMNTKEIRAQGLQYVVAYNLKRTRN